MKLAVMLKKLDRLPFPTIAAVDIYTSMNASKSYVYNVAQACDRNETTRKDSAGAILYSAEKSTEITLQAIQI